MPRKKATNSELTSSIELREAQRRLGWAESYVQGLEFATAMAANAKVAEESLLNLRTEIDRARTYIRQLTDQRMGTIHPRKRPKNREQAGRCFVYLDECGSSHPNVGDNEYQAFVLAAVIVKENDLVPFNAHWNTWKKTIWGTQETIIHEPEIRRKTYNWNFNKDKGIQSAAEQSLNTLLFNLPFKGIAVVVRRPQYIALCQEAGLDSALPIPIYTMALDFLCERIVMALESDFDGAKGEIIAEARGPKDDARLQHEFVRLHLDGTSYIADGWFRQQLSPAIDFQPKDANIPGLQVADLLARPCGDKVLNPTETPARWDVFSRKLVMSRQTLNSPLGIKIMPWDDQFRDLLGSRKS